MRQDNNTIFVAVSYPRALCYFAFHFDGATFPTADTPTVMHPLVESCSSLPLLFQHDMSPVKVQFAFLETSCSHLTPAAPPEFAEASPWNRLTPLKRNRSHIVSPNFPSRLDKGHSERKRKRKKRQKTEKKGRRRELRSSDSIE